MDFQAPPPHFVQHCPNLRNLPSLPGTPKVTLLELLEFTLQSVTLLEFDIAQNDKQTFLVKYKLFY